MQIEKYGFYLQSFLRDISKLPRYYTIFSVQKYRYLI
jgi:hypothetical protein